LGLHLTGAGFYKDREGIVHLEGVVKNPSEELKSLFTLPAGYRPPTGTAFVFASGTSGGVVVGGTNTSLEKTDLSGKVAAFSEFVVLEGITYRPGG
jgi:hypothetical protein